MSLSNEERTALAKEVNAAVIKAIFAWEPAVPVTPPAEQGETVPNDPVPPTYGGVTPALELRGTGIMGYDFGSFTSIPKLVATADIAPEETKNPHLLQLVAENGRQFLRMLQPGGTVDSPRLGFRVSPTSKLHVRWIDRYSVGWTTDGVPVNPGDDASYKPGSISFAKVDGRVDVSFSNGFNQILTVVGRDKATGGQRFYGEAQKIGGTGPHLGSVGPAMQDGQWYETILCAEQVNDSQFRARLHRHRAVEAPKLWGDLTITAKAADTLMNLVGLGLNFNRQRRQSQHRDVLLIEVAVPTATRPKPFGV